MSRTIIKNIRLFVIPLTLLLTGGGVCSQSTGALSGTYIKGEIGIFDTNALALGGSVIILDSVRFVNATQKGLLQSVTIHLTPKPSQANSADTSKLLTFSLLQNLFNQEFASEPLPASQETTTEASETNEPTPQRTIVRSVPYHSGASPVVGGATGSSWAVLVHDYALAFAAGAEATNRYGYKLSIRNHVGTTPSPPPKTACV